MSKIVITKYMKEQAQEYADNEAEIRGFQRGSEPWKKSLSDYLAESYSTMSVGRNPYKQKYKAYTELYPEVFGEQGFAGTVSKNYTNKDGNKGLPLKEVQDRILSSISNLSKLFENGVLGTKTSTKGTAQGKIENKDMSDLQFPNQENFSSKEEFEKELHRVVFTWYTRDAVTNAILETLKPFWTLSRADIKEIMAGFTIEEATHGELMKEAREEFIKRLRGQVGQKMAQSYKKIILG